MPGILVASDSQIRIRVRIRAVHRPSRHRTVAFRLLAVHPGGGVHVRLHLGGGQDPGTPETHFAVPWSGSRAGRASIR